MERQAHEDSDNLRLGDARANADPVFVLRPWTLDHPDLDPYQRIAPEIRRKLGLLEVLTTFRVAEKFMEPFGTAIDKMTTWRLVQKTGDEIEFFLDPQGEAREEAEGTGIGIRGLKKRGKELKLLVLYMKGGTIQVAEVNIGSYNGNWNPLFKQSLKALQEFTSFFLETQGDTSIQDELGGKVKILYQRCLWHIPHRAEVCPVGGQGEGETKKSRMAVRHGPVLRDLLPPSGTR